MSDHQHEVWEVWDAVSNDGLHQIGNQVDGLRQDLAAAVDRIYDLERAVGELRAETKDGNVSSSA